MNHYEVTNGKGHWAGETTGGLFVPVLGTTAATRWYAQHEAEDIARRMDNWYQVYGPWHARKVEPTHGGGQEHERGREEERG